MHTWSGKGYGFIRRDDKQPVITRYTALKSEERCFIRDVGPPFLILGGLRVAVSSANERTHELRRSR